MKSVEAVYKRLCNDAKFQVVFTPKHDFHHLYKLFLKCRSLIILFFLQDIPVVAFLSEFQTS